MGFQDKTRYTAEEALAIVARENTFANWLNRIDARIDYDMRRALGTVSQWRENFELGQSETLAIEDRKTARDNLAYISGMEG